MELGGSSLTICIVSSRDKIWAVRLQEGYHTYSTGATQFGTAQMYSLFHTADIQS